MATELDAKAEKLRENIAKLKYIVSALDQGADRRESGILQPDEKVRVPGKVKYKFPEELRQAARERLENLEREAPQYLRTEEPPEGRAENSDADVNEKFATSEPISTGWRAPLAHAQDMAETFAQNANSAFTLGATDYLVDINNPGVSAARNARNPVSAAVGQVAGTVASGVWGPLKLIDMAGQGAANLVGRGINLLSKGKAGAKEVGRLANVTRGGVGGSMAGSIQGSIQDNDPVSGAIEGFVPGAGMMAASPAMTRVADAMVDTASGVSPTLSYWLRGQRTGAYDPIVIDMRSQGGGREVLPGPAQMNYKSITGAGRRAEVARSSEDARYQLMTGEGSDLASDLAQNARLKEAYGPGPMPVRRVQRAMNDIVDAETWSAGDRPSASLMPESAATIGLADEVSQWANGRPLRSNPTEFPAVERPRPAPQGGRSSASAPAQGVPQSAQVAPGETYFPPGAPPANMSAAPTPGAVRGEGFRPGPRALPENYTVTPEEPPQSVWSQPVVEGVPTAPESRQLPPASKGPNKRVKSAIDRPANVAEDAQIVEAALDNWGDRPFNLTELRKVVPQLDKKRFDRAISTLAKSKRLKYTTPQSGDEAIRDRNGTLWGVSAQTRSRPVEQPVVSESIPDTLPATPTQPTRGRIFVDAPGEGPIQLGKPLEEGQPIELPEPQRALIPKTRIRARVNSPTPFGDPKPVKRQMPEFRTEAHPTAESQQLTRAPRQPRGSAVAPQGPYEMPEVPPTGLAGFREPVTDILPAERLFSAPPPGPLTRDYNLHFELPPYRTLSDAFRLNSSMYRQANPGGVPTDRSTAAGRVHAGMNLVLKDPTVLPPIPDPAPWGNGEPISFKQSQEKVFEDFSRLRRQNDIIYGKESGPKMGKRLPETPDEAAQMTPEDIEAVRRSADDDKAVEFLGSQLDTSAKGGKNEAKFNELARDPRLGNWADTNGMKLAKINMNPFMSGGSRANSDQTFGSRTLRLASRFVRPVVGQGILLADDLPAALTWQPTMNAQLVSPLLDEDSERKRRSWFGALFGP